MCHKLPLQRPGHQNRISKMGLLPGLFELVLATVSVAYASVTPPAIPMVFAEGDPYKIGFTIVSYI